MESMKAHCPYTELVSVWLDGELGSEDARALVEHLPTCPICRKERASLEQLSEMFDVFRESAATIPTPLASGPRQAYPRADSISLFRRALAVAALVVIGFGALFSLAQSLSRDELQFERYLERSLDQDVLEVAVAEDDLSRDKVVSLLISSSY